MKENELCKSCMALQFCQFQVNYNAARDNGDQIIAEKATLFERSQADKAVQQRLKRITQAAKDRGCPFV